MSAPRATEIQRGIRVSPRGYARDYSCHLQHGGNTGLVHHMGDYWQCQGCGNFIGTATIREAQDLVRTDASASREVRS